MRRRVLSVARRVVELVFAARREAQAMDEAVHLGLDRHTDAPCRRCEVTRPTADASFKAWRALVDSMREEPT